MLAGLQVTSLLPTTTGFTAQFSAAFNPAVLHIYDNASNGLRVADVQLVGPNNSEVFGSLVVNSNLKAATFISTTGALEPGNYSARLRSSSDGFTATDGTLLDGDNNGTPGGDYVQTFSVAAPSSGTVSIALPSFTRGPGQSAGVVTTVGGLPITLGNAAGVSSIKVTLNYDPTLLKLTGITKGTSLPANATVSLDTSVAGAAVLTYSSSALSQANATIASIQAQVPTTAPYGASQVLHLSNLSINNGSVTGTGVDGLQLVAYLGDANRDADYSGGDGALIGRVAVGLDGGFAGYPLTDPTIVADVNGDGQLSGVDRTLTQRFAVGFQVDQIVPTPPTLASIDPGSITTLNVGSGALNPSLKTSVVVTSLTGLSIKIPTTTVTASSVTFAVPPLLDNQITGSLGAGTVIASVQQTTAAGVTDTPLGIFQINELPQTGLAPGAVATTLLTQLSSFLSNEIQQLQSIAAASAGRVSVTAEIASVQKELTNLNSIQQQINSLISGQVNQIVLGQSNGLSIVVNSNSLAMLDRVIASIFLNNNFVVGASSATASSAASVLPEAIGPAADTDPITPAMRQAFTNFVSDSLQESIVYIGRFQSQIVTVTSLVAIGSLALLSAPVAVPVAAAATTIGAFAFIVPTLATLSISTALEGGLNATINGKAKISDFANSLNLAITSAVDATISFGTDFIAEGLTTREPAGEIIANSFEAARNIYDGFTNKTPTADTVYEEIAAIYDSIHATFTSPTIGISGGLSTFNVIVNGPPSAPQAVTITNTGHGTLNFSVGTSGPLQVSPNGGQLAAGQSSQIMVSAIGTGLKAGNYPASISVFDTNATNSPQVVNTTVSVVAAKASASPGQFTFQAVEQQNANNQTLTLSNVGPQGTLLNYGIGATSRVQVTGSFVQIPSGSSLSFTVHVNTAGLTAGQYSESIQITNTDDPTNTITIPVTITILQPPAPILQVSSASLSFTAQQGQVSNAIQVQIGNGGPAGSLLNYSLSDNTGQRLHVSGQQHSQIPAGGADLLTFSFTATSLAPGSYNYQLTITSDDNRVAPRTIPISVQVTAGQIVMQGSFTGQMTDNGADANDPPGVGGGFRAAYGGPAQVTITQNTNGTLHYHFFFDLNNAGPEHWESAFAIDGNVNTVPANLTLPNVRMGDGDMAFSNVVLTATQTTGSLTGSWRYVRTDPTDLSDSGSGTFSLQRVAGFAGQSNLSQTTAAVTSSLDNSVYGQAVTITATVTPSTENGTPTGMVTFMDGLNILGRSLLSGGKATLSLPTLNLGTRAISVVYGGDSKFAGTTSTQIAPSCQMVAIGADPFDASKTALFISGTAGNDVISVKAAEEVGRFQIDIDEENLEEYFYHEEFDAPQIARIVIFGGEGNDSISVADTIGLPVLLDGGVGNDTLNGGGGANILLGGQGADALQGGASRNLLIGGVGTDMLRAGSGQDILIGGTTDFDHNLAALIGVMLEWDRTDVSYLARTAHLILGGGLNGSTMLNATSVHGDGQTDLLISGLSLDLYFASLDDQIVGKKKQDIIVKI